MPHFLSPPCVQLATRELCAVPVPHLAVCLRTRTELHGATSFGISETLNSRPLAEDPITRGPRVAGLRPCWSRLQGLSMVNRRSAILPAVFGAVGQRWVASGICALAPEALDSHFLHTRQQRVCVTYGVALQGFLRNLSLLPCRKLQTAS